MTSNENGQSLASSSSSTVQGGSNNSEMTTTVPPTTTSASSSSSGNVVNDDIKSTTNSSLHQQQQYGEQTSGSNLHILVTPSVSDGRSEPLSPRDTAHRRATSISSNGYPANTPATPVHPQFTLHPEDDNDSDNGKSKGKKNNKKKKWHVNAMGEIVYKEHNSYNLMRQIQMGIRSAISEITPKKQKDVLLLKDFTNINKMPFPEKGSTRTPPHVFPYFDFYDYSPFPFRHLRERFGIDASNYLLCLCHDKSLSILGTPGKSGALFFFSADMQYMLKTVTKKESKFLRKILPDYYNHVMANPNTLITRFYGMYSIKPRGGKNVRFIVMNNVFDTTMYVSERYDLKGSTVGREASDRERKRETPIYKDLDFLKRSNKLRVGGQMKNLIMNQLQVDATWLEKMKIMDYSLLVGVHRLDPDLDADVLKEAQNCTIKLSDSDVPSEAFTAVFNHGSSVASSSMTSTSFLNGTDQGTAASSLNTTNPITEHHDQVVNSTDIAIEVSDESNHPTMNGSTSNKALENIHSTIVSASTQESRKSGESTSSFFGRFMNHRLSVSLKKHYRGPRASLFQQFHGGTLSLPLDDGSREIYYFGIIDLLQKWNNKKQIENIFKGLMADRNQISAVSPKNYAMRFVKFLGDGLQ